MATCNLNVIVVLDFISRNLYLLFAIRFSSKFQSSVFYQHMRPKSGLKSPRPLQQLLSIHHLSETAFFKISLFRKHHKLEEKLDHIILLQPNCLGGRTLYKCNYYNMNQVQKITYTKILVMREGRSSVV